MSVPSPTIIDECGGIEVPNDHYLDYRKGQTDLLRAFRIETNKRIRSLQSMKALSHEASLVNQGAVLAWREARRLLSELTGKEALMLGLFGKIVRNVAPSLPRMRR